MFFTKNRQLVRWIIIIASFAIISLILWNTYTFFQKFKDEERAKMEIWSNAQKIFSSDENNPNFNFLVKILNSNSTTPILVVNVDGTLSNSSNIDFSGENVSKYVEQNKDKLIRQFESENAPIEISYIDPETQKKVLASKLYYGNAPLLNKLKYYPLALLLIIFLFASVVYFFYRSSKIATQNKLWSGMAKETAHQIGTPLSSLIGWAEILKTENVNPEYILEIEKDIDRLQTITERFSKIGSLPTLQKTDIVKETQDTYDYLKTRSSKLINFTLKLPEAPIYVNLNPQLYSWTIENLVKNAIDAMKGKGDLTIVMTQLENNVKINIIDTGKGLNKSQFKSVFEPGYTTKKRGWGLGLSLARRIVEDFHDGKIKVAQSQIGRGTIMQIALKTV
ncbi:HAMP domain-containing sensor histidine kinase [Lacinutrix sp. Bg11-31]|uniref:sensor histidine kinase n=1 Tax=Lacinutrix sp. Bg11-31 TaxID=2057808 RepID=UPI000C303E72|nr:HAMP domain-containing sensor histidine kinase [Lacinutrix sp. Bg11-31]AUC83187.1 two-component sensor histidine kinase [Lacinutrix sp. Bg11-31]